MVNKNWENCNDSVEDENVSVLSQTTTEQVMTQQLAFSTVQNMASLPPKKKMKSNKSSLEQSVSKLHEIALLTNETHDEYGRFGMHISAQLKKLPLRSYIILQEKIQRLITQERLNTMDYLNNQTEYSFSNPTLLGRSSMSQTSNTSSSRYPISHTTEYQEISQHNTF